MSYDIGLYTNTGIEEIEVVDVGNYTYNVSGMFYEAFGEQLPGGINALSGMVAKDAIVHLKRAVSAMIDSPNKYMAMNPSNEWGNYEGALNYLRKLLYACISHPAIIIRVY